MLIWSPGLHIPLVNVPGPPSPQILQWKPPLIIAHIPLSMIAGFFLYAPLDAIMTNYANVYRYTLSSLFDRTRCASFNNLSYTSSTTAWTCPPSSSAESIDKSSVFSTTLFATGVGCNSAFLSL